MAKKILTQAAYDVDNVQQLPVQVKGQASLVQQTFDKTGLDQKTYNNTTLLSELQSETANDAGANAIGTEGTFGTNNVADELKAAKVEIDSKADTGDVVTISDVQTVTGEKTFNAIKVPLLPSVDADAASKKYIDDSMAAGVPLGNPLEFLRTNAAGDGVEYSNIPNDNATNISANQNGVDQALIPNTPSSGTSNAIVVTIPTTKDKFDLVIDNDITGLITIDTGSGALNLYSDFALSEQQDGLVAGIYTIYNRTTAFYLAPKGADEWGGLKFIINNLGGGNISITDVEFNGTQYELTDDSSFRVEGSV